LAIPVAVVLALLGARAMSGTLTPTDAWQAARAIVEEMNSDLLH
jgi:hypothetical protein